MKRQAMQAMPGEKFAMQMKYEKRLKGRNRHTRHHNFAKTYGGRGNGHKGSEDYLSILSAEHHALFHKLFGLRAFREAADVLMRLDRIHTTINPF